MRTHTLSAVIGLGSNLGDRRLNLGSAVRAIRSLGQLRSISSLYETAPVGGPEQGHYLNAAVSTLTELSAHALLSALQRIEAAQGRGAEVRASEVRWGPRALDLDILWLEQLASSAKSKTRLVRIDSQALSVPHPRLTARAFALRPLLDVHPEARDPATGVPLDSLLTQLKHQRIDCVATSSWARPFLPVD